VSTPKRKRIRGQVRRRSAVRYRLLLLLVYVITPVKVLSGEREKGKKKRRKVE
jgi:hypothetical protein